MRIVPYRVLFLPDKGLESGKQYGLPSNMLEVKLSPNGDYYKIETHDRGDGDNDANMFYYQIAFRIEDPYPYQIDELSLHIDSSQYGNADYQIDNDLYCDPNKRNSITENLWYQRSIWKKNDKTGDWKILEETRGGSTVDCITTSGVFRIVVKRNGVLLEQFTQPWIYVLPSSITKDEYLEMLSDLIRLNEALIRNKKSTIGIGTLVSSTNSGLEEEIKCINNLLRAAESIMTIPSELLGKRYKKKNINQVKHFDSRVIRDYIKNGMSGKVTGVEYYENHDTYENRIIKYSLHMLGKRSAPSHNDEYHNLSKFDINNIVRIKTDEKIEEINSKRKSNISPEFKTLKFKCRPPFKESKSIYLEVDGNVVRMNKSKKDFNSHNALKGMEKEYNNIVFYASSKSKLLFYLSNIINIYDQINAGRPASLDLECSVFLVEEIYESINMYVISDIASINDKRYISEEISDEEYLRKLNSYNRNYLHIKNPNFIISYPETYNSDIIISANEIEKIRKDISERVKEQINYDKNCCELDKVLNEVRDILKNPWFENVTLIDNLKELRETPKFRLNKYYSEFYKYLLKTEELLPQLEASFDVNAFGVNSTQLVYECWFLYKLLSIFDSLGFRFNEKQKCSLKEHFLAFVKYRANVYSSKDSNKKKTLKFSGYTVELAREDEYNPINIEIGYDKLFEDQEKCQPDFYICIKNGNNRHWYFLDTKYKSFTKGYEQGKVDYLKEIYDVSIKKYIYKIEKILNNSPEYSMFSNKVLGSYIIMASCDDINSPLAETDRLFGGSKNIFSLLDNYNKKIYDDNIRLAVNPGDSLPKHRYGAVIVKPGYEDELKSLIQLIFEYLEGYESGYSDVSLKHKNLMTCWNCGNILSASDRVIVQNPNENAFAKYYVTCPKCSAFRVDNHCISPSCHKLIVKHPIGSYHKWDDKTESKWAFLCPQCSKGVGLKLKENNMEEADNLVPLIGIPIIKPLKSEVGDLPF